MRECWEIEGNFWDKSIYTEAQARELSKTLVNCQNCYNCSYCSYCVWCVWCINCENCSFCKECAEREGFMDCDESDE